MTNDHEHMRKNFGFFRSGSEIYALDKIFPTATSLVTLGDNVVLPVMGLKKL